MIVSLCSNVAEFLVKAYEIIIKAISKDMTVCKTERMKS